MEVPGPNDKLAAPPLGPVIIAQREVRVLWEERLEKHEITHQLEPGDLWPTRTREGIVLQFLWTTNLVRSGVSESMLQAVILDEKSRQLIMLPVFSRLRVAPPLRVVSSTQEAT